MTLEALMANMKPYDERLHQLRGFRGAVTSAANIKKCIEGSDLLEPSKIKVKVQDAYSMRSTPQVIGAARDAVAWARQQVETELNGVGDNPVFLPEYKLTLTGANFQGTPVSLPMDMVGIGLSMLSVLSERRLNRLLKVGGKRSADSFHRALGKIVWDKVGLARNAKGLQEAIEEIRALRAEFRENILVPGSGNELNQELEKAARVADFLELGELMARDALTREESCGGHFREEYQTEEGEALRDDERFQHVAVWEFQGDDAEPVRHEEPLVFETVKPTKRSYK
jgi:succinate dehydrogenase/fumarate reductase flavoprotein subunit